MSTKINSVLYNIDQTTAVSTAEQKRARDNIGAFAASASASLIPFSGLNYSGTVITGISGSSLGGGIGEVYHDSNLTGSGTSAEPLGLADSIFLSNAWGSAYYGPTFANLSGDAHLSIHHEQGHITGDMDLNESRLQFEDTYRSASYGSQLAYMHNTYVSGSANLWYSGLEFINHSSEYYPSSCQLTPVNLRFDGTTATADLHDSDLNFQVGFGSATYNQNGAYYNNSFLSSKYEISAATIDVQPGFATTTGTIYLGPQETWNGQNILGPKISVVADSASGLQISHSGLQISQTASAAGGNKIFSEYDIAGARLMHDFGDYWLYEARYQASGVALEYAGDMKLQSNLTYTGLEARNTSSSCSIKVSASAIGISASGHPEITLDYNFFTSLSAWATAQGWTP